MVISYEIPETSLRRVSHISYKMTTSVRFCLSYDPLNGILSPLKWHYFIKKRNFIRTLSMTLRVCAKVLLHVWSNDFYDTTLSIDSNMTLTFFPIERVESGAV